MATVFVLAGAGMAAAQTEGSISTDEDDLFGGSDELFGGEPLVTDVEQTETNIAAILLTSDQVQIGGRYSMSLGSTAGWNDLSTVADSFFEPDTTALTTSLSTQLYFDARPTEDFRVFGKMTASYPFTTDPDDPDDPVDPVREFEDVFHVDELFSDFNWNDSVFFRGGKQTVNWGVGYFYSPADLLSISEINPEDPEAEREGPVAIKANIPIGIHNIYAYAIPAYADEPLDIGLALKGEVVAGVAEFTAGAIYQRDIAPAAMLTVSTSLGDVDLFAEGVASYGSNRTFVEETDTSPLGVQTYTRSDEFLFSATAGFSWRYSVNDEGSSIMLISQYLYNGEGYADPTVLSDNPAGVAALIGSGELGFSDIQSSGRHYSATNVGWSDMFGSGINSGVFWMQNYSDLSAWVTPSLSTSVLDAVDLTLQVPIRLGEAGDELAPTGNAMSINFNVSLGGGSF
jgi:hypothetical protein